MYFQIAAVLSLEYEEYLDFFYPEDQNKYLNRFYFQKLVGELPNDVAFFWRSLYESYPDIEKMSNLFYYGPINEYDLEEMKTISISSHNFLERENFYKLKHQLKQITLHYLIEDFGNIPTILEGKKFDVIYLSAMQNYIWDNIHGYNYYEKLKEYDHLLSQNGVIQGGYIYWQHYKKDKEWYDYFINLFAQNGYERENIDIIPGVQTKYYNIAMLKRKRER